MYPLSNHDAPNKHSPPRQPATQHVKEEKKRRARRAVAVKKICARRVVAVNHAKANTGENMNPKPLYIRAEWDAEAHVWVATSDDVPGLATEASTVEKLIKKLRVMIPELLELNGGYQGVQEATFEVLSRRFEPLQLAPA